VNLFKDPIIHQEERALRKKDLKSGAEIKKGEFPEKI